MGTFPNRQITLLSPRQIIGPLVQLDLGTCITDKALVNQRISAVVHEQSRSFVADPQKLQRGFKGIHIDPCAYNRLIRHYKKSHQVRLVPAALNIPALHMLALQAFAFANIIDNIILHVRPVDIGGSGLKGVQKSIIRSQVHK
ncbi:hypothetical protein D3C80_1313840 [compost metagenome]